MELRYFISIHWTNGEHWEIGYSTLEKANRDAREYSKMFHNQIVSCVVREVEK